MGLSGEWVAALRERLAREPGLAAAWLFGSAATGKLAPWSDVDLALLWDQGLTPAERRDRAALLGLDLEATVGGREVQVVDMEDAGEVLPYEVFRRGRPVFEGDTRRRAAFAGEAMVRYFDFEHWLTIIERGKAERARRHLAIP